MDQELENKLTLKDKIFNLYNYHKKNIFFNISYNNVINCNNIYSAKKEKNNILISEKYVLANLNISQGKKLRQKFYLMKLY